MIRRPRNKTCLAACLLLAVAPFARTQTTEPGNTRAEEKAGNDAFAGEIEKARPGACRTYVCVLKSTLQNARYRVFIQI
jgi:hypothetical protein